MADCANVGVVAQTKTMTAVIDKMRLLVFMLILDCFNIVVNFTPNPFFQLAVHTPRTQLKATCMLQKL